MRVIISTQGDTYIFCIPEPSQVVRQSLLLCRQSCLTYAQSQFCTVSPPRRGGTTWRNMYQLTYQQRALLIASSDFRCELNTGTEFQPDSASQTGEAILLAPSGLGVFPDVPDTATARPGLVVPTVPKLNQFGRRYVLVKTRRRVTKDGGASILVVDN
jgi:hypothetical protein